MLTASLSTPRCADADIALVEAGVWLDAARAAQVSTIAGGGPPQ